ncbi:MAG: hypothetical protein ABSG43_08015 [Solirubrobacteraceae bacterium]
MAWFHSRLSSGSVPRNLHRARESFDLRVAQELPVARVADPLAPPHDLAPTLLGAGVHALPVTLDHADDYVTKPFGLAELRSQIRAVLRRAGTRAMGDEVLVVDRIMLDRAR